MTAAGLRRAAGLLAAALALAALLALPDDPARLRALALPPFPLELPAILLALAALRPGRAALTLRAALVALLTAATVLTVADLAMRTALGRGFNPVADAALIEASVRLIAGAVGPLAAAGAVAGALLAVALVALVAWRATGVWVGVAAGRAAGAAALAAAALVVADAGPAAERWPLPGEAAAARLAAERVRLARVTLAELRAFRAQAAADPFAGQTGLFTAIDRDVLVVFVESYGRASLDTPLHADLHRATLAAGAARLAALGLATRSGLAAAPTRGGQSWLSHATFANGLWIGDQVRYGAALASGRQTLFHLAQASGFRTAAVMPQITLDWPESALMGFGTVLAARDLGYAGLPFNWVTMPDQFTLAALDRLLRSGGDDRRLFAQVALASSHAPWVPVPDLVDWDGVGDGRVFNAMAQAGDPPEVVWRDEGRIRAQYRLAIDYSLRTVIDYAARHADDPPLMIVLGDHQAAGFVAMDERPDVPVHVIGPAHLVDLAAGFAPTPGLIPAPDAPVVPMDQLRDRVIRALSPAAPEG